MRHKYHSIWGRLAIVFAATGLIVWGLSLKSAPPASSTAKAPSPYGALVIPVRPAFPHKPDLPWLPAENAPSCATQPARCLDFVSKPPALAQPIAVDLVPFWEIDI